MLSSLQEVELMNVLLLTNFAPDNQQSMLRFGATLFKEFSNDRNVNLENISPKPVFTKLPQWPKLKKWSAYLDKYSLFPTRLKREILKKNRSIDLIHIIDHSNAPYLAKVNRISGAKKLVTCHDLIAIQTALGEFSEAPASSNTGKVLQKWILKSLNLADHYACDSKETQYHLNRLIPNSSTKSSVIHLGTVRKTPHHGIEFRESRDEFPFDLEKKMYILHVGSAAWYKNRRAVFRSFYNFSKRHPAKKVKLLLIGPEPQGDELDPDLKDWFKMKSNWFALGNIPEDGLSLIYKHANVLLFPSFIEGFGWPPLEASLHGCPVITNETGAIYDLLGKNAFYINPYEQSSIDLALQGILEGTSPPMVQVKLPNHEDCREMYFKLYQKIIQS
jgi:glycosyltransferase involved in cell wall biosynthesis